MMRSHHPLLVARTPMTDPHGYTTPWPRAPWGCGAAGRARLGWLPRHGEGDVAGGGLGEERATAVVRRYVVGADAELLGGEGGAALAILERDHAEPDGPGLDRDLAAWRATIARLDLDGEVLELLVPESDLSGRPAQEGLGRHLGDGEGLRGGTGAGVVGVTAVRRGDQVLTWRQLRGGHRATAGAIGKRAGADGRCLAGSGRNGRDADRPTWRHAGRRADAVGQHRPVLLVEGELGRWQP